MEKSSTHPARPGVFAPHLPDDITVRHWFAAYGVFLLAVCVPLAVLISSQGWSWSAWMNDTKETFSAASAATKLLGLVLYMSLCCTFLPLPTGWIVAAVAMRAVAVCDGALATTLVVALVAAAGSTIANLNEYHIFTWMLRHRRIAVLRHTRTYQASARWFSRAPFLILMIFNTIPVPIDVARMLAITYRYPRVPFAAANFVGRFIRYGVIAFVTYRLDLGRLAVIVLLAVAVAIGLARLASMALRRALKSRTNRPTAKVSGD